MKNALIIFVKTPLPGLVKTRLQPDITENESVELYTAFLKDLDHKFYNQDNYICWYAVSPEHFDESILGRIIHLEHFFQQEGQDLGDRMSNAFLKLFNKGYEKIVLIGSDLPSVPLDIINQSLQDLDNNACVLGPSKDGGYYLIALNNPISVLFEDQVWSTSTVLKKTIETLDKMRLTYVLLPEFDDIDTSKELISFYHALKVRPKNDPDFPQHSWSAASKLIDKR